MTCPTVHFDANGDYRVLWKPRTPHPFRNRKISVSTRLSQLTEPRRDDLRRRELPTPKYAIPEVAQHLFPKLVERQLEEKFPHSRLLDHFDVLYYTRGKLGERIMRERNKLDFTILDEYNRRKVVMMSSYDPLHDPYLAHYLTRPVIKQHLECQGFLRGDDHVVCSLKHFNEFRKYLGTAQNDFIANNVRQEDQLELEVHAEMSELRALTRTGPQRREAATARKKLYDAEFRKNLLSNAKRNQERRDQAEKMKEKRRDADQASRICRTNVRNIAYDKTKLPNIEERKVIMMNILRKEEAVELRLLTDRISIRKFKGLRNIHRTQRKISEQLEKQGAIKNFQVTVDKELRERAVRRQEQNEKRWKRLPELIEKQRVEKVRLETLVRKYFYRWLNKTRQRRKRREDEKKGGHDSHWDVTDTMEKANLGICDERGQIVDPKAFIAAAKRQIALEIERARLEEEAEEDEE